MIAIADENGSMRVRINDAESPLAMLRRRKDATGRPLINDDAFKAGERLRSDYTLGNLMPSIGVNWDVTGSGSRANGVLEITDAALAARQRVERALEAVGPELSGVLVDVCCFLKGLEAIERERQWPVRSAKLILKTALAVLDRHYHPAPPARRKAAHHSLGNGGLPAGDWKLEQVLSTWSRFCSPDGATCLVLSDFGSGERSLCFAADAADHGAQTIGPLRRQVFVETELLQDGFGVDRQDLGSAFARIEHHHDGDETAHDMRIGIADEFDDRIGVAVERAFQPYLADAAPDLVGGIARRFRIGLQVASKVNDIAIAIFPIIEKIEISNNVVNCLCHAKCPFMAI